MVLRRHAQILASLALLVTAGAGIPAAAAAAQYPQVGGYRAVATTDQGVQAAAAFAAASLGREGAELASVDAAHAQVVQGMNYRLDFTMSDGSRWRVVVYRALNGTMQAGQAQALPAG